MGIKYFFSWIKKTYPNRLKEYTYLDKINHDIDILGIDINGLIHNSAQRIYKYGNYKQNKSFLNKIKNNVNMNVMVYKDVCETIDKIVRFSFPKKKLVLCIDGVAPRSKQNQQRSRRFRAIKEKNDSKENDSSNFDGNCISPGTKFMDGLSNYIEIFIHKKITNDMIWQNLKVIFASEKTPGEGEHNIVQYFKQFSEENDVLCLHGMDADLFMLGLSCHRNKNFHILRESNNNTSVLFDIDIKGIREDLCRDLIWKHTVDEGNESKRIFKCQNFSEESLINDFIFMCFASGNDFLPHIPSIEILNNGLNIMFDTYREIASNSGHLTSKNDKGDILINKKSVKKFFEYLGTLEKTILQEKVKNTVYFKDEILENNTKFISSDNGDEHNYEIDIKGYKNEYYNKKVFVVEKNGHGKQCLEKICLEFYRGLQWVLTYYTKGCVDYEWYFPYHYSPFLSDLAENISKYSYIPWKKTKCREPFKQLLSILPEESNGILPMNLRLLASNNNNVLGEYFPKDFEVDMAGFKNSWEGVSILPFVDSEKLDKEYMKVIGKVDRNDMKRNEKGYWKQFQISDFESVIKMYSGNFNSKAEVLKIDFE
jgi:5'-3' exoribonuclease 1